MQVPDFGEEAEDGVRWKIIENHSTLCPRIVPYLIAAIAVSNLPDSHPKFCRRFGNFCCWTHPEKNSLWGGMAGNDNSWFGWAGRSRYARETSDNHWSDIWTWSMASRGGIWKCLWNLCHFVDWMLISHVFLIWNISYIYIYIHGTGTVYIYICQKLQYKESYWIPLPVGNGISPDVFGSDRRTVHPQQVLAAWNASLILPVPGLGIRWISSLAADLFEPRAKWIKITDCTCCSSWWEKCKDI